jgi:hypothetical protein
MFVEQASPHSSCSDTYRTGVVDLILDHIVMRSVFFFVAALLFLRYYFIFTCTRCIRL